MTERERILEKIKRVRALAERGVDGEKDSATALLDRMMEKYGITETELAEERREIGEMSLEEAQRISMMMAGMDEHTRRKMLESGAGT